MKKVIAVLLLSLVFAVAFAGIASAQYTQDNWRVYVKTTDTNGVGFGEMTLGVYSSSKDGYGADGTASDAQDSRVVLSQATNRAVVGVFDSRAWIRDVKSNRIPGDSAYNAGALGPWDQPYGSYPWEANRKIWDLRLAGLGSASTLDSVLTVRFVSSAAGLPPLRLPDPAAGGALRPVEYRLRMVDNRGISGAPANGTGWLVPVPATFQTSAFLSVTLPTFNISVPQNEAALLDEGYKMQFIQQVVPEPSSLLALAFGLAGLGLYRRTRGR